MKNKREEIVKVLKAHKKAVDFLNSSPTAGNDIIAKHFHLKTVTDPSGKAHSPEQILSEARKRLGWEYRLTKKDKDFIQRLMNYSHKLGYIKKELKISELMDSSLMDEALK